MTRSEKKEIIQTVIIVLSMIVFIIVVRWYVLTKENTKTSYLSKNGIVTYATVMKIGGSKGNINHDYEFNVNGNRYEGYARSKNTLKLGQKIKVLYSPQDPSNNCYIKDTIKEYWYTY